MKSERVIAVFGLGIFGREVCKALSQKGGKVIAVDKNPEFIDLVKNYVTQAVLLDSTNEEALRGAGLQDADVAVVTMRGTVDSSILTTILLKNLGIPVIVARAVSDIHAQVLKEVGATQVVNIEVDQGKRIANFIIAPDILDMIPISADQMIVEMHIPEEFVGKSLHELGIRKKYNTNIVSVKRSEIKIDTEGNPTRKEVIFSPKPMDTLKANDILVVLGTENDISRLRESVK
jgi:trk system potassium uptake protein TrkA